MQRKKRDPSRKQIARLPAIAPKDDQSSSAPSTRSSTLGISNMPIPMRSRLPPRSRSGCWTCRTRKVKCDEGRPTCGQCSRLSHECDYSPKLSFRDDTPRVLGRMQGISTVGSSVWDPSSPAAESSTSQSAVEAEDNLLPFNALMTDEEREQKAEKSIPGTFHVIALPDSFACLPEYSDDRASSSPVARASLTQGSLASSVGKSARSDRIPSSAENPDPRTVILNRFEDNARRSSAKTNQPSLSPVLTQQTFPAPLSRPNSNDRSGEGGLGDVSPREQDKVTESMQQPIIHTLSDVLPAVISPKFPDGLADRSPHALCGYDSSLSLLQNAASGGQDSRLLDYFRSRVWSQVMQVDVGCRESMVQTPGVHLFESVAASFPPLFHAMMAVSALSLVNRDGIQRLDALQHYQQALPSFQNSLRNEQDISSDGTFLTHFLLLLYEIATAESGVSNLWSNHLDQLRRITLMRRLSFGVERYPFVIWCVANLELQAILCGVSAGDFIDFMFENNMMPPPNFHLYPLGMDGSSVIYSEEAGSLPPVLQLNSEITVIAARLGQLARELRDQAARQSPSDDSVLWTDTKMRQGRIFELQESLRELWQAPAIILIVQAAKTLPPRSLKVLQQASSLYHACLIYSHTSMWPSQRMDTGPESDDEIRMSAASILQTAQEITNAGNLQHRFIVFPLFMAGVASSSGSDKMLALDLMITMEKEGLGRNTTTTRHLLQIVYGRQTQKFMNQGHSLDVDWMKIMVEQGLQIVNFGL